MQSIFCPWFHISLEQFLKQFKLIFIYLNSILIPNSNVVQYQNVNIVFWFGFWQKYYISASPTFLSSEAVYFHELPLYQLQTIEKFTWTLPQTTFSCGFRCGSAEFRKPLSHQPNEAHSDVKQTQVYIKSSSKKVPCGFALCFWALWDRWTSYGKLLFCALSDSTGNLALVACMLHKKSNLGFHMVMPAGVKDHTADVSHSREWRPSGIKD